jgi:hypothetical protein
MAGPFDTGKQLPLGINMGPPPTVEDLDADDPYPNERERQRLAIADLRRRREQMEAMDTSPSRTVYDDSAVIEAQREIAQDHYREGLRPVWIGGQAYDPDEAPTRSELADEMRR